MQSTRGMKSLTLTMHAPITEDMRKRHAITVLTASGIESSRFSKTAAASVNLKTDA